MVTVRLQIEVELSEYVEQKTRTSGLCAAEKIAELITTEVERQRQQAAAYLLDAMEKMSAHMREEFGDLSNQQSQAMIDAWIAEAEAEIREERRDRAIARTREILANLHRLEPQLTEEEIAEELRKPSVTA